MAEWWWDDERGQYYDAEEERWLEWAIVLSYLYTRIDRSVPAMDRLALLLAKREIPLSTWERQFRDFLAQDYIQAYILGRGGLPQMDLQDWVLLSDLLDGQFDRLHEFAEAILNGELSEAEIAWRSRLYLNSIKQAYWRAYGRSQGWPELPAYPGDCSTRCCTNCLCSWRLVKVEGGWLAYWELAPAEHCDDCIARGHAWSPLRVAA